MPNVYVLLTVFVRYLPISAGFTDVQSSACVCLLGISLKPFFGSDGQALLTFTCIALLSELPCPAWLHRPVLWLIQTLRGWPFIFCHVRQWEPFLVILRGSPYLCYYEPREIHTHPWVEMWRPRKLSLPPPRCTEAHTHTHASSHPLSNSLQSHNKEPTKLPHPLSPGSVISLHRRDLVLNLLRNPILMTSSSLPKWSWTDSSFLTHFKITANYLHDRESTVRVIQSLNNLKMTHPWFYNALPFRNQITVLIIFGFSKY